MINLGKTADSARKLLEKDLFMIELLKEEVINITALARKILPQIKKENPKATLESVSIAIRRYTQETKKDSMGKELNQLIAGSQLFLRSDMIHLTFERNHHVANHIFECSSGIRWDKDEILLVNQGAGEISVVMDQKNVSALRSCYKYVIQKENNVSTLSIKESHGKNQKPGVEVPGLYSYFLTALARNSISVLDTVSTRSQLSIILCEESSLKAYDVLSQCIKHARSKGKS